MTFRAALTAVAITCAAPVAAQQASELYVGGALDYNIPNSGSDEVFGTVLAGFGFDLGTFGVGLEAEYGTQFSGGDDRDISRTRAFVSYDFNNITSFATVGAVQYEIDGQNSDGETFGLGLQAPFTDNLDGRVEVIRDLVDGDFDTNVTSTRIAVLYKF